MPPKRGAPSARSPAPTKLPPKAKAKAKAKAPPKQSAHSVKASLSVKTTTSSSSSSSSRAPFDPALAALASALAELRELDSPGPAPAKRKAKAKAAASKSPSKAAGNAADNGTGYGGTALTKKDQTAMKRKGKEEAARDKALTQLFDRVEAAAVCLPPAAEGGPAAAAVAAALAPFAGPFAAAVSPLLRNDSLPNIAERAALYLSLLSLLSSLSDPRLSPSLCPPALLALLASLDESAQLYRRINESRAVGEADLAVVTAIRASLATLSPPAPGRRRRARPPPPPPAKGESAEAGYVRVMAGKRCGTMPLLSLVGSGGASHAFKSSLSSSIVGDAARRTKRISMEFATMLKSLPCHYASSIFVRADEDRLDVLKALVIGPEDTPYQDGCFVFDIVLPPNYPQEPPKVLLVTTGGNRCRFNPNLYAEGKVCLSLLGTWSGPGWDPAVSTLLQVLMSVQALIFVKDPYHNEPGFEGKTATNLQQSTQ
ncbi:hypothetical protein TeGR_g2859 [Tetraparma gracilis]|uniref:UBC core domain-containing protein n=1 Tax=Tetraparma gracilis TaxID=2962635 RepID=A0ABQ6MY39_9STRA|nr:hypothetical protein TeGR_g2859 [Tetraparma gracilis]